MSILCRLFGHKWCECRLCKREGWFKCVRWGCRISGFNLDPKAR